MLSSVAEDPSSIEAFIESLFDQKLFTIAFGAIVWFVIEWGVRRNNMTKLRNQMIKVSPEMKDMIMADPKYKFDAKQHWKDQVDEIILVLLVGLLLIEFDDVAIEYLNLTFMENPIWGRAVYLMSGPLSLGLYKLYQTVKGAD